MIFSRLRLFKFIGSYCSLSPMLNIFVKNPAARSLAGRFCFELACQPIKTARFGDRRPKRAIEARLAICVTRGHSRFLVIGQHRPKERGWLRPALISSRSTTTDKCIQDQQSIHDVFKLYATFALFRLLCKGTALCCPRGPNFSLG